MGNKKLKTLNQNNLERMSSHGYYFGNTPIKNGIECPNCKEELYDSRPLVTLASYPSKKDIHCEKCGYKGYRIY